MSRWLARAARLGAASLAIFALVGLVPATPASAHGERSQEAFLRTRTASWVDVKFSTHKIQQGEAVTITGSFYVLKAFPEAVPPPSGKDGKAYLGINTQGPSLIVTERSIGGVDYPQTLNLEQGKLYDFQITAVGRLPGRVHIHPGLWVKAAGMLVGPGEFVEITRNPDGFANNVQLANGTTVNLENFGFWGVFWWQVLLLLVGAGWLIYWLIPNPIIARAKVVGAGIGDNLITPANKRASVVFAVVALLFAIAGPVLAKVQNPDTLPPQVRRDRPAVSTNDATDLVKTGRVGNVTYDPGTTTMRMDVEVTNTTDRPVALRSFNTSNLVWDNRNLSTGALAPFHYPMQIESGDGQIAPGQTTKLRLVMADDAWEFQRLISTNEVSARIGGVLYFADDQGRRQVAEIDAEILPVPGARVRG